MLDRIFLTMQAEAGSENAVAVAAVNAVPIVVLREMTVVTVIAVAVEIVNAAVLAEMSAAAVVTVSAIAVAVATVPLLRFATTTLRTATGVVLQIHTRTDAAVLHHPCHLISPSVVAPTSSMSET